jgi:2-polyprenyl-6-methoxyphenol hydroxylase-like FAD-dependent oxidoreductase
LDCFDFIQNKRFGSVKHMHVWDGSSDSFISFNGKEDDLALIVENDLIQASLSHNLHQFENINVLYSSQVKDFNYSHQDVILKLNDGKEINTKLLIGSDGANSFIRNKSNFKVTKWDYDQVAIVATLKLAEVKLTIYISVYCLLQKKIYISIFQF